MEQYRYRKSNGEFDYELYKKIQTAGNKTKITYQWVTKESIEYISAYIKQALGAVGFGICHGTRRGAEQLWFRETLGCEVIGTEISDTAEQFPFTLQWDFHETKLEWINQVDFIYSNSWDHSYDPVKLFNAWMSCLKVGGLCILEHTPNQTSTNELDPLGLTQEDIKNLVSDIGQGKWEVIEVLKNGPQVGLPGMYFSADHVIIRRNCL